MNQNHVIDSWVAELALGARSKRPRRAARRVNSESARAALAAAPARYVALRDRPRPPRVSFRPCLPAA